MRLSEYDRILWDFNGTLLDDLALCLASINLLLTRRGLPPLEDENAYREVFDFPVQSYYTRVGLPGEGDAFVEVAHEWVEAYRAGEHTTTLRDGALPVLRLIRDTGVPQGVLSATEQKMLGEQVDALGIRDYFDMILGRGDIYATDKSDIAVRYRATHPVERILMLGDTVHDYKTALAGGFDCVLVTGGHQSRRVLEACGCPVVEGFEGLVDWLTEK